MSRSFSDQCMSECMQEGKDDSSLAVAVQEADIIASADIEEDPKMAEEKENEKSSYEALDQGGFRNRLDLIVERSVYNQPDFDEDFEGGPRQPKSLRESLSKLKSKCAVSGACCKKKCLGFLPFINAFKSYSPKKDLTGDIVAGMTVGIMQIPQGMAYAMLAGLDPVYGLYTSFFPVLIYFFLGTSRHVSLGTFAVISLMVGTAVTRICSPPPPLEEHISVSTTEDPGLSSTANTTDYPGALSDDHCAIKTAVAVSFLGGCIQLALGLLQLGFVVVYLSESFTRGYTTGAAMHVFTSQITAIFGLSIPRYSGPLKLIYTYIDLFAAIAATNVPTLILSLVCMILLFVVKEYVNPPVRKIIKIPIPIDLIIVILATVVSALVDFETKYGMRVVGDIPKGLPAPEFPPITSYFSEVIADAFVIAIVAFAISVSMAQLFGKKHNYPVDANQELIAHGVSNIVSSNFSCYMMCVSLSRSMVQDSVGGRTQIAGLMQAVLVLIVILALADLFRALPNCVLAAIIIVALKGLFMQLKDIKSLYRTSKWDWSVWLVTFIAVVLLDVDLGLGVGVAWSFLTTVFRAQRPHSALLGRIPSTEFYRDVKVFLKASEITGIKIFFFESAIFYANRNYFIDQLYHKTGCNPKKIKRQIDKDGKGDKSLEKEENDKNITDAVKQYVDISHVLIDCSAMSYLDLMGVGALKTVINEYKEIGVTVYIAFLNDGARQMLEVGGFYDNIDRNSIFTSVHDAVLVSMEEQNLDKKGETELQSVTDL